MERHYIASACGAVAVVGWDVGSVLQSVSCCDSAQRQVGAVEEAASEHVQWFCRSIADWCVLDTLLCIFAPCRQRQEQDKAYFEEQQQAQAAAHRKAWEVDVQEKKR